MTFFCEILEDARTHQPLFKISCLMHSSDLGIDVVAYSASAAAKEFTERLAGASIRNKSGPEFFGFAKIRAASTSSGSAARQRYFRIFAAWASWQLTFLPIVHKFVPSKVVKNIKQKSPFVTPSIERAIKKKRMALRELKRCPTEANRKAFKTKNNLVTHLLRKS